MPRGGLLRKREPVQIKAEAIVIKNDETAKDKADVTDVKIVEK